MPAPITCYGDLDTGHGPYAQSAAIGPVPLIVSPVQSIPAPHNTFVCSGNVFAGTKGVHRQGDIRIPHVNPTTVTPEPPVAYAGGVAPWLAKGSTTSYANSRQIGRIGDPVVCTSVIKTGNVSVIIGD